MSNHIAEGELNIRCFFMFQLSSCQLPKKSYATWVWLILIKQYSAFFTSVVSISVCVSESQLLLFHTDWFSMWCFLQNPRKSIQKFLCIHSPIKYEHSIEVLMMLFRLQVYVSYVFKKKKGERKKRKRESVRTRFSCF